MLKKRYAGAMAALTIAATAVLAPLTAGQAHDDHKKFDKKWAEELAEGIHAKVHASMAKGAIGMEKGADSMMRGADKMDAYADRLENDPKFREREAARQNEWGDNALSAQDLYERIPELRRGAQEMREGAQEMRESAKKMRDGDSS